MGMVKISVKLLFVDKFKKRAGSYTCSFVFCGKFYKAGAKL